MTIDPLSVIPVYRQLAEIIAARIRSGDIRPGMPVPSIRQLQQEHGSATNTIRHAFDVLRDEGLIVTVPGKGNFVPLDYRPEGKDEVKDAQSAED